MTTARDYRLEGTIVLLTLRARATLEHLRAGTFDDADLIRLEVATRIAELLVSELEAEHLGQVVAPLVSPTLSEDLATAGLTIGPHSRACRLQAHEHGPDCHPNCPTCSGAYTHRDAST